MSPVNNLVKKTFGEGLWNFTVIFEGSMEGLSSIATYALIFGFLLWAVQISIDVFRGMESEQNIWMKKAVSNLIWLIILVALLKTPAYKTVVKTAIAKPAEICAVSLSLNYIDKFNKATQEVLAVYGNSKNKAWSFLTATVKGALLTQLLAGLVYVVTSAFIFITPVLQIRLFEFMVYIGPMCLVFSLCEWTRGIAKSWLNLTLAIAWLAFFGSVSLFLFVNSGLLENIAVSATWEDIIPVLVYGILCILMLLMAFPFTIYLFNAAGSGLERVASGGGAVTSAAGVVSTGLVGGAAVGTAMGAVMMNSSNKTISQAGKWMSTLSKTATSAGMRYGTASGGIAEWANTFAKRQSDKHSQSEGSVPKGSVGNGQNSSSVPGKDA